MVKVKKAIHFRKPLLLRGATKQVRHAAHANSAFQATLSQEPAFTGPGRW